MVNINGNIGEQPEAGMPLLNRGLAYGDAVFETLRIRQGKLLFWEDHYFRLMASMRIMRMEIPMNFTLEFLEEEILKTVAANGLEGRARAKLLVVRSGKGYYLPAEKVVEYVITVDTVADENYLFNNQPYEVELYKDNYISPSILSTLKTNNKAINVLGSIFAKENDYENCLLLNTEKQIVEALNANIFLVKGNEIRTPPLEDGCLKGVMRKQIVDIVSALDDFSVNEASISPFELQRADELFLTNVIVGIQPITKYRKKVYKAEVATMILDQLNSKISH